MSDVASDSRRALVTGGAGFIGSHLVEALIERGWQVTALDDLSRGKEEHLAAVRDQPGFRFVKGSVLDRDLVRDLVVAHDVVYHLAAVVGVKHVVDDPPAAIETNINGSQNVLYAAHRARRRVLLASTSEVYGKSTRLPFREDGERVLGPTTVHRWSYATAKALDEHLALALAERGLAVSVVRYFNSYGPRLDERGYGSVIARFAAQALSGGPVTVHGDGLQTRCFTYVTDTVRGTILAAETEAVHGMVFNIGGEEEVTIRDLARLVNEILGTDAPIVRVPYESYYGRGFEDTRRRVPDVSRAREVLGFRSEVPLRVGLRATLEWCRANFANVRATG